MFSEQHTQLWGLSSNIAEYERYRNLLSGELKNSLSPAQIKAETLKSGLSQIHFKSTAEIIHDGSDIGKQYSKQLPDIGKVRSLTGNIINGYQTFNSVVLSDIDKGLHLLGSTPYSTNDTHLNVIAGASFTQSELILGQISECDRAIKASFPTINVRHLLYRGHDDQAVFEYIDNLCSQFIIRLKANRNSEEFNLDAKGKKQFIKLIDAQLDHTFSEKLDKFVWKDKCYQQVTIK